MDENLKTIANSVLLQAVAPPPASPPPPHNETKEKLGCHGDGGGDGQYKSDSFFVQVRVDFMFIFFTGWCGYTNSC